MRQLALACFATIALVGAGLSQPSFQWERTYGGSGFEYGYFVTALADGSLVLAGTRLDFDTFETDYVVYWTNTDGWTTRTQIYGGPGDQILEGLVRLPGDHLMLIGYEDDEFNPDVRQMIARRIDNNGEEVFANYIGEDDREINRAAVTVDGGVILFGLTTDANEATWISKIDGDGFPLWGVTLGGGGDDDGFNNGIVLPDGGFLGVGFTWTLGPVSGQKYALMIRMNQNGAPEWIITPGFSHNHSLGGVQMTSDGGFVATGHEQNGDFYIVKTDGDGTVLWQGAGSGPGTYETGTFVAETDDGGYLVGGLTGQSDDFDNTSDMALAYFNGSGQQEWMTVYGGPNGQIADIIAMPDGSLVFGGSSGDLFGGAMELWMARTGAGVVGVDDRPGVSPLQPDSPLLLSAYPNPFNSTAMISVTVQRPGVVAVRVLDLLGREVVKLADQELAIGQHVLPFDGSRLASGSYLVQAITPGSSALQRITLVK